jgi:hypothetical protein
MAISRLIVFSEDADHGELADLFERAADVIERQGWRKRTYGLPNGEVCMIGALGVADGGVPSSGYMSEMRLSLRVQKPNGAIVPVPEYNDTVARSKATVIKVLRNAAIEQRALVV